MNRFRLIIHLPFNTRLLLSSNTNQLSNIRSQFNHLNKLFHHYNSNSLWVLLQLPPPTMVTNNLRFNTNKSPNKDQFTNNQQILYKRLARYRIKLVYNSSNNNHCNNNNLGLRRFNCNHNNHCNNNNLVHRRFNCKHNNRYNNNNLEIIVSKCNHKLQSKINN